MGWHRHFTLWTTLTCVSFVGAWGCQRATAPPPQAVAPWSGQDGDAVVTPQETRAGADASWSQRDDPVVLSSLINDLELLFGHSPNDGVTGSRLARAYFLQALNQRGAQNREGMKISLARGVLIGESALRAQYPQLGTLSATGDVIVSHLDEIDKAGMDTLTWYVSNLGAYAASRGTTSLIFYRDRVTAILERMLALDPTFMYGTPHRYWAIYLARAPAFAGGNMEQARIHFEQAMAMGPGYFANACDYAQFYALPRHDRALFERLLRAVDVADSDSLPDVAPEMRMEQRRARDLLGKMETLF